MALFSQLHTTVNHRKVVLVCATISSSLTKTLS